MGGVREGSEGKIPPKCGKDIGTLAVVERCPAVLSVLPSMMWFGQDAGEPRNMPTETKSSMSRMRGGYRQPQQHSQQRAATVSMLQC